MHTKADLHLFFNFWISGSGSEAPAVIRPMNKLLIILFACFIGCNDSQENDGEPSSQAANSTADTGGTVPTIFAVPRPNSDKYSTDEATALLPKFIERTTPIPKSSPVVTQWNSPTQGIRIHVTADDTVEIVDYFGQNLTGLDSIGRALDSTMTDGNEQSVLLTSEIAGWETPVKKAVLQALFQPSVQIYLVGNDDG